MKPALITTSWDDGHPLDLKLAAMLAAHGLRGTFYVPVRHADLPLLSRPEIQTLHRMGMEIGSHTVNHPDLTSLNAVSAFRELRDSKAWLEDLLGSPVTSFCYPRGRFNARLVRMVSEAGYSVARTTVAFRTDGDFDAARMPVSLQFVRHPRQIHFRHALKEGNTRGLWDWYRRWNLERDLVRLSEEMVRHVARAGGVFHLWGHSWEIDRAGLWGAFEDTLAMISQCRNLRPCSNSQLIAEP